MGSSLVALAKTKSDRQEFLKNVLRDITAMEQMIESNLFETGIRRFGVEQELCFADHCWRPAPIIDKILPLINDDHFVTEIARFNMEINLDPIEFKGACFSALKKQLVHNLTIGEKAAKSLGAHIILTGILPTIRRNDVHIKNLTPLERYRMLLDVLKEKRGELFEFRIEGTDQLIAKDEYAMFEGCNTSFQVHYQLTPQEFSPLFNWSQAIAAPVMAITTNSPLLLGRRLWRETRIALFQQAVDTRSSKENYRERVPRVSFGNGWLKSSVCEIYKENIVRHPILLRSTTSEDPLKVLSEGGIPKLHALNVHNGTIWSWNRACYGQTNGLPHLRIENRIFPSGPTVADEVANAAFWLGLMHGLPDTYRNISEIMDFDTAKSNFLKAARQGLGAHFFWPGIKSQISAKDLLLKEMLPIARSGLEAARVSSRDINRYLGIIEERTVSEITGAQWITDAFQTLKKKGSKDEALMATVAGMYARQKKGKPGHTWDLPDLSDAGDSYARYQTVEQIMITDLFTINEDDPIEFATRVMDWENIRHLPVENDKGELVGIVSSKNLINHYSKPRKSRKSSDAIKKIMIKDVVSVSPRTSTLEATSVMHEKGYGCLPVVKDGKLVGIVTEMDFLRVASELLTDCKKKSDKRRRKTGKS
jgi:CBS domain-containing protein